MNDMAARRQDAAATLEELRALLDEEERLDRVLVRLAETATRTIPAAVAVSVTVLVDDRRNAWTATATDDVLADDLATALTSRAEIEQAKGVLMARHGVLAEDAFQMLARESQNTNTKLRNVAHSVLDETIQRSGTT
jgi:hypothetical protein